MADQLIEKPPLALQTEEEQPPPQLVQLQEAARDYIRASKASNTLRAYKRDWAAFESWCSARALEALPASPAAIVLYLTQLAGQGRKASTITRHAASISIAHQLAGHKPPPTQDPLVRDTLRGIRRTLGTARAAKAAVTLSILRRLVATCEPASPAGLRDRALLLIGLASAMRRSELVSLDVGDLAEDEDGLTINLRRSKSDPEASGRKLAIPYGSKLETCPIRAVRAWRRGAEIESGPLWRPINRHGNLAEDRLSDKAVADIIKRAALRAGFDPSQFAGHSLRRGFATIAARNGAPERWIQRQTGHRSVVMLRAYVEEGTLFTENAASYLGL